MADDPPPRFFYGTFLEAFPAGVRPWIGLAIFGAAFFGAYHWGWAFSDKISAPFWFPDTVLLTTLLLTRRKFWWLLLLATLPIRLLFPMHAEVPIWALCLAFANDSLKAAFAAYFLRRSIPDFTRLARWRESRYYAAYAVIAAPVLSAFAGAATRSFLGYPFWPSWIQWFLGDSLANLVLTSTILYWLIFFLRTNGSLPLRRVAEAGLLAVGLSIAAYLDFAGVIHVHGSSAVTIYAPVPFLLWAAIRFGPRGAASALCVVACFSIWSVAKGFGPAPIVPDPDNVLGVQIFLFVVGVPMLALASIAEDRSHVGEALRMSEERMELAARMLSLGFWVWDPAIGRIWTSEKLGSLLGLPPGESVTPENFLHRVAPEDRPFVETTLQKTMHEHVDAELEYRVNLPEGGVRWIETRGRCQMDEAGRFKQIIGMSMDVTAQKVADLQMRAQLEEMSHLSRLAVVGELTASIAHEINQPLGAILSNAEAAEMLLESPVPLLDPIREILADIRADDARATEVVRRLRALLRKRELEIRPLDFNELVRETLRFVGFDARRRGVDIFAVLAPSLPQVQGDKLHLQQVLLNLILNGMDAMAQTPERNRRLRVATQPEGKDGIECCIEDSGPGIPSESLDKLFDSFFSTKPNGVGLGLSIARSIVEAHRGRIWAENKRNGGAVFHLVVRTVEAGEIE